MKIDRRNSGGLPVDGGFGAVFRIALPLILSNSCHAANMFFDRLMLARCSNEAVAAAFTGGLTHFTCACIFIGTVGYTGTFVAQYDGSGHRDRIGRAMWQGIFLALLGTAVLTTGIWWAEPLFSCFGHDPGVAKQEAVYFRILSIGSFSFMLVNVLCCFWSGRGRTNLVLAVSMIMTLFNLPLNYLFIFGKCGLPAMGTAGAAWGTVGAEVIGLVIYAAVFFSPSARRHFQTHRICFDKALIGRMLRYGLPNGIHLALDLIAFNTFGLLLGCYGVAVHEASGITFGINNIAFCPAIGIGMAASILVGRAVGAERIPLAKKALKNCLVIVTAYTFFMVLLFSVFQDVVLYPFMRPGDADQAQSIRIAGQMLYFISGYLLIDGCSIVLSNALRGAGDTRFTMWAMTGVGIGLFALPCLVLYLTGFPWWTLWIALESEIVLLCTLFFLRYRGGRWTKMRVIEVAAVKDAESDSTRLP